MAKATGNTLSNARAEPNENQRRRMASTSLLLLLRFIFSHCWNGTTSSICKSISILKMKKCGWSKQAARRRRFFVAYFILVGVENSNRENQHDWSTKHGIWRWFLFTIFRLLCVRWRDSLWLKASKHRTCVYVKLYLAALESCRCAFILYEIEIID